MPDVKTALFEQMNKNYPLLSDEDSIYIVIGHVVKKQRSVKPDFKDAFAKLQVKKQKDKRADPLGFAGPDLAIKEMMRRGGPKNDKPPSKKKNEPAPPVEMPTINYEDYSVVEF